MTLTAHQDQNASKNTPTMGDVKLTFVAAQETGAYLGWRFARILGKFVAANPQTTFRQIGAELAAAVGRSKPYSKPFVSRALKAARLFPDPPATAADKARFLDVFHGSGSADRRTKGDTEAGDANITAEQALKRAIRFARLAVRQGMNIDAVEASIHDSLNHTETALSA